MRNEKGDRWARRGSATRAPFVAIAGVGMSDIGKIYGRTVNSFAVEAVRDAAADAGIGLDQIDGLLIANGVSGTPGVHLQRDLALRDLSLVANVTTWGTSAAVMLQWAARAIAAGDATTVACVLADAPLRDGKSGGESYRSVARNSEGWSGITKAAGVIGGVPLMAAATRRHMLTYGTTSEQLGHIAVAQREWAQLNPQAMMTKPMSLEDHQNSRWVAEPLRMFDCCLVSNGALAIIVTSAERARDLAQPPVHLLGYGQSNPGYFERRDENFGLVSGAVHSAPKAFEMAGLSVGDVDVVQFYDCFTWTVLVTLEDYGFCAKGEGGEFVSSGVLGPGGSFPLNTGGGQLSAYYFQGMTPLVEGVIQARGAGGERQAADHDVVLVSNNGGALDHHATLILGSEATIS